ncbi:hypothetical protein [Solihabitans fulvus]|uniref:hypothetical protein n=1 Tax=Solihabitans fulvus TaxID=1892852 RepID=UPI001661B993|nr:hypothetical protein [Solihabitans fulvus]
MTASPTRAGSPRRVRLLLRTVHLLLAGLTGYALYARHGMSDASARDLLGFVVFPLLIVTGVAMWQQARVRRMLRGDRSSESASIR